MYKIWQLFGVLGKREGEGDVKKTPEFQSWGYWTWCYLFFLRQEKLKKEENYGTRTEGKCFHFLMRTFHFNFDTSGGCPSETIEQIEIILKKSLVQEEGVAEFLLFSAPSNSTKNKFKK